MKCMDKSYHCLCAYLIDEEPDPKEMGFIEADPELCPKCKTCGRRHLEVECQREIRSLLRERSIRSSAPDFMNERVKHELETIDEYRDFGSQVLDVIPWGTHIAQFYNIRSELAEVWVPYIKTGLQQNELCVWITAEMSQPEALDALSKQMPDVQNYIEKRQLQMFSYKDWYLSGGNFNVQKVLDGAFDKCVEAQSDGYSGFRVTGNTEWLNFSDWDSFMEYERLLDNAAPEQKALILCVYKEAKCTKGNIVDVMDRHKYVISKIDESWRVRRAA